MVMVDEDPSRCRAEFEGSGASGPATYRQVPEEDATKCLLLFHESAFLL